MASNSAQPEGIGPVVAVVGTKGWQCLQCNMVFPRAFSIDHHMMASHHSQILSATGTFSPAVESLGKQKDHEHSPEVQDAGTAGVHGTGGGVELSSSKFMEGVRSQPVESLPCSDNSSDANRNTRRVEGSFPIKTEPNENSSAAEGNSEQSPAALSFVDQRNASSSAEASVLSRPVGNLNNSNTSQNVQDMIPLEGCQPFSFAHCHDTAGSLHVKKHGKHKSEPLKTFKTSRICCEQMFYSKKEFREHGRDVHGRYKHRTFICPVCCLHFQHKRGLNRHLKEKGEAAFACSKCPKQFHDPASVVEHTKVCDSLGAYGRDQTAGGRADEGTDQVQNALLNKMTHHHRTSDSFPWECSKCKKHFEEKDSFRKHLKQCGIFEWRSGRRHFTCNLCNSGFNSLVGYHRHYVHAHKLPWLSEGVNSPAHSSPFLGNSPVPSPSPSVTSEINTAMASVSLNQTRAADARECPSPSSSTVEQTSSTSLEEEEDTQSSFQDSFSLVSTPQTVTGYSGPHMTASSIRSLAPLAPDAATFSSLSLASATDSSGPESLTSTASTSGPQSLASTSGSSDRPSLKTGFSCLYTGISLSSTTSSGQTSNIDSIVISDDESQSSHSLSDSDEDWEILMDQSEEEQESSRKKGTGPKSAEGRKTVHKEGGLSWGDFHHHHYHHPPHPPPPHPDHPFPSPFFTEHFGPAFCHFSPFSHPRFPFRGGFPGRFMHGCGRLPFFGAARFGPPVWFSQEDSLSDQPQHSEHATAPSSPSAAATSSLSGGASANSSTNVAGPNQEFSSSQQGAAAQDPSQSSAFSHAADFCKWAGKWKKGDGLFYKLMMIKMMCILKNRHLNSQLWVCPQYDCQQTFMQEEEVEKHCQEMHTASKEFVCLLCQQHYSGPGAFNKHIREHCAMLSHIRGRGRGHGCGRGGLMGWGRKMFKHFWKAGSPYNTPYNMFGGPQTQGQSHQEPDKNLHTDKDLHTSKDTHPDKDPHTPDFSSPQDFKECPVCKKKYRANSRENFFERHVNSHYGVEVFTFECEQCGKKFLEKGKFTEHMAKHKSSPHMCQECGKSYQSKTSLTRHQRMHTGERPHKCPDCNEGFIELRELERHRMKHTGQDPFTCTVCGSGFTLKDSLLNHIRKKHPDESPVLCCRRAMPLSEADYQRRLQRERPGSLASQPPDSHIKVEVLSDQQGPSVMDLG